ncbi:polyprenol phosphomannose-dependent alpha 1,6 mannosyltransferase MptB [Saccharomonospora iraqiensis]|uniref:polyprenol phosphomannose-dependent alpha 1,6 mannosyltransferase MptB n=1 Tax=Saccharomonospora iraqiensis TaxID=52698 RepID=UPI00022DFC3E|nr:polyprenol phosphomannose-dependent alpha 1,6 mannosyltransferase MptB [Saccharomonospora iraqiensis]
MVFGNGGPAARTGGTRGDTDAREGTDARGGTDPLDGADTRALALVRRFGTVGALLLAFGSLGAGAAPILNPVHHIPVLRVFARIPTVSVAVAFAGMGMMVLAWLCLGRFTRPDRPRVADQGRVLRVLVTWTLPLVVIPPLFSRDVYSYLAQSEIVRRGFDPYALGPAQALGVDDPFTAGVSNMWRDTPAPYGPLFLEIGSWISEVIGTDVALGVLLQRLLALVGFGLIVWALPRLARRYGVRPGTALWLGAANPLVLFHLVAGAHNEALGIGLMLAGLELGMRRLAVRIEGEPPPPRLPHEWTYIVAGAVVISLAAMVKIHAVVALGFLGVMVARRWHGRITDLAAVAGLMLGVVTVVSVAVGVGTGLGFGWIGALETPAMVWSWVSPVAELGQLGGVLGVLLGLGNHTASVIAILGLLGYLVAGAVTVKFLWDGFRWRYRPIIGLGVSLGTFMLLHVAMQPWWLLWAVIPLAAAAGTSRFRVAATGASAVLALLIPPTGSPFDGRSYILHQAVVAGAIVVLLAVGVMWRKAPSLLRRPGTVR